jgi:hypothetical protein
LKLSSLAVIMNVSWSRATSGLRMLRRLLRLRVLLTELPFAPLRRQRSIVPPVRSVYFVAEKDPEKAKAIIGTMMAPNEKVEAWGPLPEAAVKALGFETWRLQARLTGIE